jgi:mannose-1-phosphate guanylyltransferase
LKNNHFHIVIAGGSGQRFWPLSRLSKPKQLLSLIHEKSLIRLTVDRIKSFSLLENIFIVSNQFLANKISKEIPELNKNNFIIEPSAKNTAPAIGIATAIINQIDPKAVISVYPSDHYISNTDQFKNAIFDSYDFLDQYEGILVLGIQTSKPSTAYGYIQVTNNKKKNFFKVSKFVEKPNLDKAKIFIQDNRYYWNSGVFIFKSAYMLNQFKYLLPDLYDKLIELDQKKAISLDSWNQIVPISFDHGILENSKDIYMFKSQFDWSDVGSWDTMYDYLSKNNEDNVSFGNNIIHESSGNLIYGNKGLTVVSNTNNMVIISTDDVTLVISKDKAQSIKDIIKTIEKKYR